MFPRKALINIIYITLILGFIIGSLVPILLFNDGNKNFAVALCIINFIILITPMFNNILKGKFDAFEPIYFIIGAYLLYFVVFPLYTIYQKQYSFLGLDLRNDFYLGVISSIIAILSIYIGYYNPLVKRIGLSIPSLQLDNKRIKILSMCFSIITLCTFVSWIVLSGVPLSRFFLPGLISGYISTGNSDYIGESYNFLYSFIEWTIPTSILGYIYFKNKKISMAIILLLLIIFSSIGFRFRVIILVISFFYIYQKIIKKNNTSTVNRKLVFFSLILVFLVGWIGANRTSFRGFTQGEIDNSISTTLDTFMSSLNLFTPLVAVIKRVPDIYGYAYFEPLLYILIRFIPREIWPTKPSPDFLNKIPLSINTMEGFTAGAAVPHFGEYYIAFGYGGIVIGCIIFGMFSRFLLEFKNANKENNVVLIFYIVSLAHLIQMISRGYAAQTVQEYIYLIFPLITIMIFSQKRVKK
ncbi:oligosaccharide repeat unit polymerase [Bacillus infantis]|uniref:O-antigen polymerase n=1 Tax=Bacillus infantis TaxID=324767 RepID=UPI00101D9671|nr:O-antigen polymerase [Bacillus infantis]RYI28774.1 oligosaccharide repeat unit polymerase [Bacillus infantis]